VNKLIFLLTLAFICGIMPTIKVETAELTPKLKIQEFIECNSSLTTEQAKVLADRFIVRGYERAKWLAATAKVESDFTSSAVGSSGEVSMFQILDWPKGKDHLNIDDAIDEALKVRNEKQSIWEDPKKALAAYNGNPKLKQTKLYANRVSEIMRYL